MMIAVMVVVAVVVAVAWACQDHSWPCGVGVVVVVVVADKRRHRAFVLHLRNHLVAVAVVARRDWVRTFRRHLVVVVVVVVGAAERRDCDNTAFLRPCRDGAVVVAVAVPACMRLPDGSNVVAVVAAECDGASFQHHQEHQHQQYHSVHHHYYRLLLQHFLWVAVVVASYKEVQVVVALAVAVVATHPWVVAAVAVVLHLLVHFHLQVHVRQS